MVKKGLLTKKVAFQGTQVTMYSIDGVTWSTRPEELEAIIQRHILQQAGVSADLKGEEKAPAPKVKPKKFNRVHDDSELDEVIEEDGEDPAFEDDDDSADDTPVKVSKAPGKVAPIKPLPAQKSKTPAKAQVKAKPAPKKTAKAKKAPEKKPVKKAPPKSTKPAKPKPKKKK